MDVIPAIDLLGGRCVRLYQGDYNQAEVFGDDDRAAMIKAVQSVLGEYPGMLEGTDKGPRPAHIKAACEPICLQAKELAQLVDDLDPKSKELISDKLATKKRTKQWDKHKIFGLCKILTLFEETVCSVIHAQDRLRDMQNQTATTENESRPDPVMTACEPIYFKTNSLIVLINNLDSESEKLVNKEMTSVNIGYPSDIHMIHSMLLSIEKAVEVVTQNQGQQESRHGPTGNALRYCVIELALVFKRHNMVDVNPEGESRLRLREFAIDFVGCALEGAGIRRPSDATLKRRIPASLLEGDD
jgi:hypothetical protein